MTVSVTVDAAGALVGGAARFKGELDRYLARTGRGDARRGETGRGGVAVLGSGRLVTPGWLVRREALVSGRDRCVALNNVGFIARGAERWTLLRNPLHFLTDGELSRLGGTVSGTTLRKAAVVRLAAQRSDTLVTPTAAMAERVSRAVPSLRGRIVVRPHPVSADPAPAAGREPLVLCPVLFSSHKGMADRITGWLGATERAGAGLTLAVTATPDEVPAELARHPRIQLTGRLPHSELRRYWARCGAVYFPTTVESFGYPLAEARANGIPVIALDTALNREVAGGALRGYTAGDPGSLLAATLAALSARPAPDPGPFDPDAYFGWLLGGPHDVPDIAREGR